MTLVDTAPSTTPPRFASAGEEKAAPRAFLTREAGEGGGGGGEAIPFRVQRLDH